MSPFWIIALSLTLAFTISYDTYSHYMSSFVVDNFGNMFSSGIKFQTFNDDQTYMGVCGLSQYDPMQIYYK